MPEQTAPATATILEKVMSKYTAEQVESLAQGLEKYGLGGTTKGASSSIIYTDAPTMLREYAALLRERESANHYFPKVSGISRDGECNKALSIFFASRPTDDEMRAVHDYLNRRESAKAGVTDEMIERAARAMCRKFDPPSSLDEMATCDKWRRFADEARCCLEAVALV